MHCFRYKLDHDYGLAPNPFGGVMTLAVCKGDIRKNKNLAVGDWIIGTGSKRMNMLNQLIYAMRVEGWMTFDEYWNDSKYAFKKPVLNGSLDIILELMALSYKNHALILKRIIP